MSHLVVLDEMNGSFSTFGDHFEVVVVGQLDLVECLIEVDLKSRKDVILFLKVFHLVKPRAQLFN